MRKLRNLFLLLVIMLSSTGLWAADYGLPSDIQQGNILHCFDWKLSDIKASLPQIASAGFGAVQTSPLQRNVSVGAVWYDVYRPYDFRLIDSGLGSKQDLKDLCSEAAKYGVKVVVDVVFNHIDGSGWHDSWWDTGGRIRSNTTSGNIDWSNRDQITRWQSFGPEVNTENSDVQQRAKAYIEELKACGVKGIRFDAAKHIATPAEGSRFWSTVTSVSGMYYYGEVLDSPGGDANSVIKEYEKYMSVTDNGYSAQCLNSSGVPGGNGGWCNVGSSNKVVLWSESHDTYSNGGGTSSTNQHQVDLGYAITACRNGETSLYFSRPSSTQKDQIKVGQRGDISCLTKKEVTMVNKFRNAMVGKLDYFSNSNGCGVVTRKGGGACIVKNGGGNVSVTNGGGYAKSGTFKDRVSGNTFTVTATTISGNVSSSGVAVFWDDSDAASGTTTTDPDDGSDDGGSGSGSTGETPKGSGTCVFFKNTAGWSTPKVWAWNTSGNCNANGTWPGDEMTRQGDYYMWTLPSGKSVPTQIIFSNNGSPQTADLTFVNGGIYDASGSVIGQGDLSGTGGSGSDSGSGSGGSGDQGGTTTGEVAVYLNNTASWSSPTVWAWNTAANCNVNGTWPGDKMTLQGDGKWKWTLSAGKSMPTQIIFSNNGSPQTADLDFVNGATYNCSGQVESTGGSGSGSGDTDTDDSGSGSGTGGSGSGQGTTNPNAPSLNNQYYMTNPNGKVGTNKTINMQIANYVSSSALTSWTANELIAQGAANDVCQMFRGGHEYPFYDTYALYAAYDDNYLYLGCQYVNVFNDDKDNCKPYGAPIPISVALDLDPEKSLTGEMESSASDRGPWMKEGNIMYNNGMDALVYFSAKQGGTPGIFLPKSDGKFSYDAQYCKSFEANSIGYQDGLLPSISHIWGKDAYGYDYKDLENGTGFSDLKAKHQDAYHTFYEIKLPLQTLGITKSFIQNTGIGVMWLSTHGASATGSLPYDPCTYDNALTACAVDESTSGEKDDRDVFTYAMARIGHLAQGSQPTMIYGVEEMTMESPKSEVYTLDGRRIRTASTLTEAKRGLTKGVYIINGKKMVVK